MENENLSQAIPPDLGGTPSEAGSTSSPVSGGETPSSQGNTPEPKYTVGGKEYTASQLETFIKGHMRQEDYTRKTQEFASARKSFEQTQKFYEHLPYDLKALRSNPALAENFRSIYPKEFHSYLEAVLEETQSSPQQAQGQLSLEHLSPEQIDQMRRILGVSDLHSHFEKQEAEKNRQFIDSTFESAKKEFPNAKEGYVVHMLKNYRDRGGEITKEAIHLAFRKVHEEMTAFGDEYLKAKNQKQLDPQKLALDAGAGGLAPGKAPVKFKDVGEHWKAIESAYKGA